MHILYLLDEGQTTAQRLCAVYNYINVSACCSYPDDNDGLTFKLGGVTI